MWTKALVLGPVFPIEAPFSFCLFAFWNHTEYFCLANCRPTCRMVTYSLIPRSQGFIREQEADTIPPVGYECNTRCGFLEKASVYAGFAKYPTISPAGDARSLPLTDYQYNCATTPAQCCSMLHLGLSVGSMVLGRMPWLWLSSVMQDWR
ncbi:hypothetical protein LZ30DRAFT_365541 [Colletotrichum cereale]|nr:hypothetical protein LZ30DRAFT_365541 [Colletotrichum cereale]